MPSPRRRGEREGEARATRTSRGKGEWRESARGRAAARAADRRPGGCVGPSKAESACIQLYGEIRAAAALFNACSTRAATRSDEQLIAPRIQRIAGQQVKKRAAGRVSSSTSGKKGKVPFGRAFPRTGCRCITDTEEEGATHRPRGG